MRLSAVVQVNACKAAHNCHLRTLECRSVRGASARRPCRGRRRHGPGPRLVAAALPPPASARTGADPCSGAASRGVSRSDPPPGRPCGTPRCSGVRRAAAKRRALRGAYREAGQPPGLHRPVWPGVLPMGCRDRNEDHRAGACHRPRIRCHRHRLSVRRVRERIRQPLQRASRDLGRCCRQRSAISVQAIAVVRTLVIPRDPFGS